MQKSQIPAYNDPIQTAEDSLDQPGKDQVKVLIGLESSYTLRYPLRFLIAYRISLASNPISNIEHYKFLNSPQNK